jgi:hypothetical protein
MVGDVHGSGRSPYITAMEAAINSFEPDRIYKYFREFCNHDNCSLQIDMNEFSADEAIPIFRDIRGVDSISSYFVATVQSMPDCIYLFWQKNVLKNPDGTKEVRAEFHSVAKRLYEINVLENEHVHEDLESAIFGLAALAGGQATVDPDTVICSEFPPYDDASSSASSEERHSGLDCRQSEALGGSPVFALNSKGQRCKLRNLDSMNILVADTNVEFVIGARFPEPIDWNNKGTFTWTIDTDHKVTRMRFVYTQVGLGQPITDQLISAI